MLIPTLGTAGDVHPYVAIALALRARGHEPVILTNPYFKDRILAAGVGFWPVGTAEYYLKMVTHTGLVSARSSAKWVFDNLIMHQFEPAATQLGQACKVLKPDVVFAHHIVFGAIAAAEVMRVPLVQGVLAPLFWLSRHEPLAMPTLPIPNAPAWLRSVQRHAMRRVGQLLIDPPVNKARRSIGAPRIRDYASTGARGGDGLSARTRLRPPAIGIPTLGLWSAAYRPVLPDDPSTGTITGFCFWDRPPTDTRDIDAARTLCAWMDAGPPPVLITLGSSVSHHGKDLYRACIDACTALNQRAVLLTGVQPSFPVPDTIQAVPYAPYSMVMPRAALVIHHAGIGTLAAAMRAGVPSLIVPFANDEFDNAARAKRLGVAHVLARARAKGTRLRDAIAAALADPATSQHAKALAITMQHDRGSLNAALAIEHHAQSA